MSIGAVLDLLRPDFPDVTISKIRFLEAEGLVTPQRAASGYRRFTAYDCARLRFVLTAQRDQYLPLKVIKAQLDAQPDRLTAYRDWCRLATAHRARRSDLARTRRRWRPPASG
jgi:DNA-binding transcriptional MerR regulator